MKIGWRVRAHAASSTCLDAELIVEFASAIFGAIPQHAKNGEAHGFRKRGQVGPVIGASTDWTPLDNRPGFFPEDIDESDPWQFRNILVR